MLITEMIAKLKEVSFLDVIKNVLERHLQEIADLNKEQLTDGLTYKDQMIRPKYTEDPYFKSRGQALGYAKWKAKLEDSGQVPKSKKGKYYTAPNLYIKGVFYGNIYAAIAGEYVEIGANDFGGNFQNKWKDIFGLTEEHMVLIRKLILPEILDEYRKRIGI